MEFMNNFTIGQLKEKTYTVNPEHAAKFIGSGDVDVLATPSMILMMENTARLLADEKLPDEYTTVGIKVCVTHENAAPVGAKITISAKLDEIKDRKLTFTIMAKWNDKIIGRGTHERFVVNRKRFLEKIKASI